MLASLSQLTCPCTFGRYGAPCRICTPCERRYCSGTSHDEITHHQSQPTRTSATTDLNSVPLSLRDRTTKTRSENGSNDTGSSPLQNLGDTGDGKDGFQALEHATAVNECNMTITRHRTLPMRKEGYVRLPGSLFFQRHRPRKLGKYVHHRQNVLCRAESASSARASKS